MTAASPHLKITTDADSDLEEDNMEVRRKRLLLKSGILKTADSHVMWPLELVYTVAGQPTVYDELSIGLFRSGYLAVMELENLSFRPLAYDSPAPRTDCRCQSVWLGASQGISCSMVPTGGEWPCQVR